MKKFVLFFFVLISLSIFAQEKKKAELQPKWKVKGRFGFLFNQSSFSNWASGGENTFAGNLNINYDFNYKKRNINWDTRLISGFGLSHLSEKGWRKTDDRFELNSVSGIKITKYWFFSFLGNFKTQYTEGFNYKIEPKESVSDFLSPAYITFGPGILWKKSDNLNMSLYIQHCV